MHRFVLRSLRRSAVAASLRLPALRLSALRVSALRDPALRVSALRDSALRGSVQRLSALRLAPWRMASTEAAWRSPPWRALLLGLAGEAERAPLLRLARLGEGGCERERGRRRAAHAPASSSVRPRLKRSLSLQTVDILRCL